MFNVDLLISNSSIFCGDWPLSRVFLKNNRNYPWFILVPRYENISNIDALPTVLQHQLIDEISQCSKVVREYFQPDQINVATLGNRVSQLHVHVVARFTSDALWPDAVWQAALTETPYSKDESTNILKACLPLLGFTA